MERHGLRVFLIADRPATRARTKVDREVLLIAGLLHDVGLYDAASHGGVYVREGAEFTAEILRARGWDEERIRLCFDAIERHHELRSQWDRGAEVELIRRAHLVDVSSGLVPIRIEPGVAQGPLPVRVQGRHLPHDRYEVARVLRHRPLTFPQISGASGPAQQRTQLELRLPAKRRGAGSLDRQALRPALALRALLAGRLLLALLERRGGLPGGGGGRGRWGHWSRGRLDGSSPWLQAGGPVAAVKESVPPTFVRGTSPMEPTLGRG